MNEDRIVNDRARKTRAALDIVVAVGDAIRKMYADLSGVECEPCEKCLCTIADLVITDDNALVRRYR